MRRESKGSNSVPKKKRETHVNSGHSHFAGGGGRRQRIGVYGTVGVDGLPSPISCLSTSSVSMPLMLIFCFAAAKVFRMYYRPISSPYLMLSQSSQCTCSTSSSTFFLSSSSPTGAALGGRCRSIFRRAARLTLPSRKVKSAGDWSSTRRW